MEPKVLEIRDVATFIPVLAFRLLAANEMQAYYLHRRCGYPVDNSSVAVVRLNDMLASADPYAWAGFSRTMQAAHHWITEHFAELKDGDVVDVEFILGETTKPKESERLMT